MISAISIAALALSAKPVLTRGASVPAHITLVNCAKDIFSKPQVAIFQADMETKGQLKVAGVFTSIAAGVYRYDVKLPPGQYYFSSSTSHCRQPAVEALTVVQGNERYVSAALVPNFVSLRGQSEHALVVRTPPGVMITRLLSEDLQYDRQPIVNGDIDFFESLKPGRHVLQFVVGSITLCRSIAVPHVFHATLQQETLTWDEIGAALRTAKLYTEGGRGPCRFEI